MACQSFDLISIISRTVSYISRRQPQRCYRFQSVKSCFVGTKSFTFSYGRNTLKRKVFQVGKDKRDIGSADNVHIFTVYPTTWKGCCVT